MEDFPEHIQSLVQKEKESEEQEKRQREIERNTCKVLVLRSISDYCVFENKTVHTLTFYEF